MRKVYWKKVMGAMMLLIVGTWMVSCGQQKGNTTAQKEYVYVPEYQTIELEEGMEQVVVKDDVIYFRTGQYDEAAGSYVRQLGTLRIGETEPKRAALEVTADADVSGMSVNADGNVLTVVTTYIYEEDETVEENEAAVEAETVEESEAAVEAEATVESEGVSESSSTVIIGSTEAVVTTAVTAAVPIGEDYQMPAGQKIELCEFDTDGKLVSSMDLTETLGSEGEIYLQYLETDAEGNLYLGGEQTVWVLDKTGKMLCEVELDSWLNNMFSTNDGRVMVVYYGENQIEVHPIDIQAKKTGEALEQLIVTDYGNYTFVKGIDTDLLFSADDSVYTYNFEDEAPELLLNWIDCDIDTDGLQTFIPLEDGRILAITSTWGEDGSEVELIYLTKKKGSEVPEKKILTLGTMSLAYDTRKQVIDFNKTNQEYRVEIKEYLTDYSMESYENAMNQMSTDIVSGACPDIIDMTGANMQRYVAKGILEDLYPYIDKDEAMSREDFLENILSAHETDGKLYALPSRFYINTIIGKQADFGDRKSISLDEIMEIADAMPENTELYEYATKSNILMWNTMMNMSRYVDWKTGECKFNSEEFVKALEFANRFESEAEYDEDSPSTPAKLREGKLLMMNISISSMQEYQMYSAMFGEPVAFIGYPTSKDNGSFISNGGSMLAMSAKSPYKDGAWEFIRRELTKEAQEESVDGHGYGFPVMKEALEKQFAKDMEEDYYEDVDGRQKIQPKTTWGYDDFSVEIYAAKEEEVEIVRDLIHSVDTLYQYDEEINKIVDEEAKAFFEGQKSAEAVADIIQSRVQIYVNENR